MVKCLTYHLKKFLVISENYPYFCSMKKIKEKQNRMNNSNPFCTNSNGLGNYAGNTRMSLATTPVVNILRSGYSPITRWKPYAFASNDSFIKGKLSAIESTYKKCLREE